MSGKRPRSGLVPPKRVLTLWRGGGLFQRREIGGTAEMTGRDGDLGNIDIPHPILGRVWQGPSSRSGRPFLVRGRGCWVL